MRAVPLRFRAPFVCLLLVATVAAPSFAAAQMLEQPLTILQGLLDSAELAAGRDGAILQLGSPEIVARLFAPGGATPSAGVTLGPMAPDWSSAVTALHHGGFAAAWVDTTFVGDQTQRRILTVRLSPAGVPLGTSVPATPIVAVVDTPGIAPLGDGFVVAGGVLGVITGQRFDATGTPLGGPFTIDPNGLGNTTTRIVTLPGDRFLVVWSAPGVATKGRLYDANAMALGADFAIASFEGTGVAVNAAGTLAAVVGKAQPSDPTPDEPRLRFFAPDGSSIGGDIVLGSPRYRRPNVASDPNGNFLAMTDWQVRAYDPNGAALGPPVSLGPSSGAFNPYGPHVVGRREGGFFAMQAIPPKTYIGRITLCTPGTAVCGDGTFVPTCELCDAGAGNSNTIPDACRTDCRPARCGDGVTDAGEQCDDGNHKNCDGCTELCDLEVGTVCGDGIIAPQGCKEQCDDGDVEAGDGCSATCKVEHIYGGGSSQTDCYATWRIDNASNDPRVAKRGGINPKQRCRDNDTACDFDGGVVGSCTFHLALCVNNTEPLGCTAERLASWTVATPSEKQALVRPVLAAVRSVLTATVVPNVLGNGDANACSPDAELVLPLRGAPGAYKANKLTLKTRAAIYDGAVDTDKLQLRCDP